MACYKYSDLKKVAIFCISLILPSSALAKIAEYRFSPGGFITELNAALQGHSKETLYTQGQMLCHHTCLMRDWCLSYNYQIAADDDVTPTRCELNNRGVDHAEGVSQLRVRNGFVYVQVKEKNLTYKTCLDVLRAGATASGIYQLSNNLRAFCHLSPGEGSAWTLFMSQSFANRGMVEFRNKGLGTDAPVSATQPNWEAYRLSFQEMIDLSSHSTHWRVTCSYDVTGANQRDSVRYKLSDFNPFAWQGSSACMKSEYVNIKGQECFGCTVTWHQPANEMLHLDTTYTPCEFGVGPLLGGADAFGFYDGVDPGFRCTSGNSATTNHWLGGYL